MHLVLVHSYMLNLTSSLLVADQDDAFTVVAEQQITAISKPQRDTSQRGSTDQFCKKMSKDSWWMNGVRA